ncbi:MAG: rhomboid family intramembrane serine protease [Acidobacteria bacterium]|nr:rhomboid family intramembrane serine protease [Acidobacteriota bacterium]
MSEPPVVISTPPLPPPPVRHRWPPVATLVILAVNVLLYMMMEWAGGSKDVNVLLDFGASYGPFIRRGEYWRLIMPMFLHIGMIHLLMNSLALFLLGRILESVYGYGRFAVLYVVSGMGSSFLSMTISQGPAAGASGSIMGTAGAMLAIGFLHRGAVPWRLRRAFGVGILPLILINLALGYSIPGIDNWGHIGGLFMGMLVSGLMAPPGLDWSDASPLVQTKPSQMMVFIPVVVVALSMGWALESHRLSQNTLRLIAESEKLRAAGQFDQAIERAREAARLAPKDERPREAIALLLLHQGRVDEAIAAYEEARRLNPLSAEARRGLAGAYVRKGDIESAKLVLEEMLGKDAPSAEGQRILGDLCQQDGLDRLAIRYYERSLELNPDQAATHNNLGWLLATTTIAELRDPARSLAHAQKAVALDGWKEATFIDTLAEALYVNGRYSEAVTTQTRALQLDPQNKEYRDHMARYLKAAKDRTG